MGLVVGLVAVLVLLVGLAYVMGWRPVAPSSGPTVNTSNLPPVGVVWFGTSFDPSTFQLSGQSDYAKAGATIAVVAHLSQQVTNGQANVRIEVGSQTILNQAMAPGTTGDVYGFTYSVIIPGSYRVTITNIGGGTLATGVLSVQ